MSVYNNEEELKRGKVIKAPGLMDTLKKTSKITGNEAALRPARVAYAGLKEAGGVLRQGMRSAANETTVPSKIGSAARVLVTAPVAYAAGAGEQLYREAAPVVKGAGEFYRSFIGKKKVPSSPPNRVQIPAARVAAPQQAKIQTKAPVPATRQAGSNRVASGTPIDMLRSRVGSRSGNEGTGYITSSGGGVALGLDGKITMVGQHVGDPQGATELPVKSPAQARRQATRLTTSGGGYRFPDRNEAPARIRVSDIAEPKTIGEVPGYRRRVEAVRADMSADQTDAQRAQQQDQFDAQRAQQQDQFEQGQGQTAAIAMQRQAQQQNQFEQNRALDERRVAGTEQQQQLAADQQVAKLAAEQRREGRTVAKEKEISAARAKFEAADTPAEKVAAGQMLNSLLGMKIDTPTKGKSPGLTPKETSQQIQGALKAFESAGGESRFGTDFYTWMRQNDTRGYQAAFGNLTPKDIRDHARIQELTDEQMMSSDLPEGMNPGETPAQFRQRLDVEYRSKRGY